LISLFEKHVGIRPKYFSSLMQFQHVLRALESEQQFSWTQLAHDSGYFDQAHFINEFKRFSGLTPVTYLGEKGEYLNYIPVR
jgi:methylphosphotriester-DNA--protein-cysteine methyltransferase